MNKIYEPVYRQKGLNHFIKNAQFKYTEGLKSLKIRAVGREVASDFVGSWENNSLNCLDK